MKECLSSCTSGYIFSQLKTKQIDSMYYFLHAYLSSHLDKKKKNYFNVYKLASDMYKVPATNVLVLIRSTSVLLSVPKYTFIYTCV